MYLFDGTVGFVLKTSRSFQQNILAAVRNVTEFLSGYCLISKMYLTYQYKMQMRLMSLINFQCPLNFICVDNYLNAIYSGITHTAIFLQQWTVLAQLYSLRPVVGDIAALLCLIMWNLIENDLHWKLNCTCLVSADLLHQSKIDGWGVVLFLAHLSDRQVIILQLDLIYSGLM